MTSKSAWLSDELHDYIVSHGTPPDELQQRLIDETAALGRISGMQIAPEQGALMTLLCQVSGARRALEVGTFTGYSALATARGLPDDGSLLCCDVSEEWTSIGRRYWDEAGVGDKIELRLGPALDTLRSLSSDVAFDIAFIDADKANYPAYIDEVVPRLRRGGLLLVDNTLWSGEVADPAFDSDTLRVIRSVNDALAADDRLDVVVLPVADGLTLARKR
ncbi:MAG TPA: class I SAM-dependent methyltransferase [Jiangellaceae bacterium]